MLAAKRGAIKIIKDYSLKPLPGRKSFKFCECTESVLKRTGISFTLSQLHERWISNVAQITLKRNKKVKLNLVFNSLLFTWTGCLMKYITHISPVFNDIPWGSKHRTLVYSPGYYIIIIIIIYLCIYLFWGGGTLMAQCISIPFHLHLLHHFNV